MFAVVCLLVMVDVIYLAVWQAMDPMIRTVREFSQEVRGIVGPNTIGFKTLVSIYYLIKNKPKPIVTRSDRISSLRVSYM